MTPLEKKLGLCYILISQLLLAPLLPRLLSLFAPGIRELSINVTYFCINFLTVSILFHKYIFRSVRDLSEIGTRLLAFVLAGFFLAEGLTVYLSTTLHQLFPRFANINNSQVAQLVEQNLPLMCVCTVILVPITEELLYRGVIFGGLADSSKTLAYAASISVFSLIHLLGYIGSYDALTLALAFVQYIPSGFFLCWAYQKSGSIFAPILIHAFINAGSIFATR